MKQHSDRHKLLLNIQRKNIILEQRSEVIRQQAILFHTGYFENKMLSLSVANSFQKYFFMKIPIKNQNENVLPLILLQIAILMQIPLELLLLMDDFEQEMEVSRIHIEFVPQDNYLL